MPVDCVVDSHQKDTETKSKFNAESESSGDMSRDKRLKNHISHKSKKHPPKPCRPNFKK